MALAADAAVGAAYSAGTVGTAAVGAEDAHGQDSQGSLVEPAVVGDGIQDSLEEPH